MSIEPLPDDWEPEPQDRVYYRRARDGQLGWFVRQNGQDSIRLDRNSQRIVLPYRPQEWVEDKDYRQLTRVHIGQVALAADAQLCRLLGLHELAKRQWLDMSPEQRRKWMESGPSGSAEREALWTAIMEAMATHSR